MKTLLVAIIGFGMISMTAFATTSELDHKPKTTLNAPSEYEYVANVENNFTDIVFESVKINQSVNSNVLTDPFHFFNFVAILTDVGWQSRKALLYNTHYKEVLHNNYLIDKKKFIGYLGLRENRFNY
jgi:hypothetical protein